MYSPQADETADFQQLWAKIAKYFYQNFIREIFNACFSITRIHPVYFECFLV